MPEDQDYSGAVSRTFEHIATTTERVGIPVATFAMGGVALGLSTQVQIAVLPWVGGMLILASLLTYVWLTDRSTVRVYSPTPSVSAEVQEQLVWMRDQIASNTAWLRDTSTPELSRRLDYLQELLERQLSLTSDAHAEQSVEPDLTAR